MLNVPPKHRASAGKKPWTLMFYNAGPADQSRVGRAAIRRLEESGSGSCDAVVFHHRTPYLPERLLEPVGLFRGESGSRTYEIPSKGVPEDVPLAKLDESVESMVKFVKAMPSDIRSTVVEKHADGTDPGSAETLKEFIIDSMERYPAERYAVIMTGHGAAFGGQSIVGATGSRMKNSELAQVFEEVRKETGEGIDLLNLNTCYGANLETLAELGDTVPVVVASEDKIFGGTQPFDKVMKTLNGAIDAGERVDGRDLAKIFVAESKHQPLSNLYTPTLSAIDTSKLGEVLKSLKSFHAKATELADSPTLRESVEKSARFLYNSKKREIHLVDLGSFLTELKRQDVPTELRESIQRVQEAVGRCVIAEQHADSRKSTLSSILIEGPLKATVDPVDPPTGLSVYYDQDIEGPNGRLKQIQGGRFAQETAAEPFLLHLGKDGKREREARGRFKKTWRKIVNGYKDGCTSLAEKVGVPKLAGLLYRTGLAAGNVGLSIGAVALGVPGLAVAGTMGGLSAANSIKKAAKKLGNSRSENRVPEALGGMLQAAGTAGSVMVLGGILPGLLMLPLLGVQIAGNQGPPLVRLARNSAERAEYQKEKKYFESLTGREKLFQLSQSSVGGPL